MPYLFAATAFIEKSHFERIVNISYMRGKKQTTNVATKYCLEDALSVLDNIKGTPRYWRTAKNEMIAKLENLGPFIFFFTLSAADKRWPENFTSHLLQGHDVEYVYEADEEKVYIDGQLLKDFLDVHTDQNLHLRENIVTATMNFNNRVKQFFKHIVLSKNNPMSVKYYTYKTEFQSRGAPHIHGTLWLDWNNLIEKNPFPHIKMNVVRQTFNSIKSQKALTNHEKKELIK